MARAFVGHFQTIKKANMQFISRVIPRRFEKLIYFKDFELNLEK